MISEAMETDSLDTHLNGVCLSWRDVSVRVRQTPESKSWLPDSCRSHPERVALDHVTGCVVGGTFLAVVGASGSGKTTLLAAITKRLTGRGVTGEVFLNGRPASVRLLRAVCGFVPQHDLATETLTATEHLSFMAAMLLDSRTSGASRVRRVRALLMDLGLSSCAHTRLQVLSGGERRRLAVAAQLLVSPPVLVLDEPCSGLDSEAARSVLDILRREAGRGRAVLCTVHQLTSDALEQFNEILVLVGGRLAYHGPLQDAHLFLTQAGVSCPPAAPTAPALGLAGALQQLSNPGGQREAQAACDAFANSELACLADEAAGAEDEALLDRESLEALCTVRRPSWLRQFWWLAWRGIVDSRRNVKTHTFNLALFLSTAVIMSLFFVNVSPTSMVGVQGARGLLYLIASEVMFTHSYSVFHTFPEELPVYLREAHLYSPSAYYAAKIVLMTPRAFVEPVLFLSIVYSLVDVTAGGGLPTFCVLSGISFMSALIALAYGCMISAMFKSADTVLVITMPVDFLQLLATGIFNTLRSLPVYINWFKYLSMFHYSYESLSIVFWNNVQHISCVPNTPCLSNGKEVLDDAGFNADGLWGSLIGMSLLIVGFHSVGFIALFIRSKQQSTY